MSGPNEHYLPRLLQRGFLIDRPGEWTVLATKIAVGPKSLKWIGSEIYFNSGSAEGKSIDDALTAFENSIGNHVAQWRNSQGEAVPAELAAKLVFNLSKRVKSVRDNLSSLSLNAFNALSKNFLDKSWIKKTLLREIERKDSEFRKNAQNELTQKGYFGDAFVQAEAYMCDVAKYKVDFLVEESYLNYILFAYSIDMIKDIKIGDAHRSILIEKSEGKRFNDLFKLDWNLLRLPGKKFILPDCAAIAVPKSGPSGPIMFWDRDVPHSVVLPISREVLLIGGRSDFIDFETLNLQFSYCSGEFFICSEIDIASSLHKHIGGASSNFKSRMEDFVRNWKLRL